MKIILIVMLMVSNLYSEKTSVAELLLAKVAVNKHGKLKLSKTVEYPSAKEDLRLAASILYLDKRLSEKYNLKKGEYFLVVKISIEKNDGSYSEKYRLVRCSPSKDGYSLLLDGKKIWKKFKFFVK